MSFWKETVLPLRDELQRRFPKCFAKRNSNDKKRALKRGIHFDIQERWPEVDKNVLKLAIGDYITGTKYLSASFDGATRIDLDGNSAGLVTREDRMYLLQKHENRLKRFAKAKANEAPREINKQAGGTA